jgi:hypothetical protein
MGGVGRPRACCAPEHREPFSPWHFAARRGAAAALLAATLAGCATGVDAVNPFAMASQPATSGASIAFESIDGPPPPVFNRMVATLNEEADARHLAVVSRAGPADYRVRAYVSALVDRRKTSFAWVWDVYDADKQRVLRITGEETGDGRRRDGWSAADDQVVRRIARSGMERIMAFAADPPRTTAVAARPGSWLFASTSHDTPEAAGIVRTSSDGGAPPVVPAH